MNGTFDSNVAATPAVQATGTSGAQGISASSDSGVGLFVQSGSGVGLHAIGGAAPEIHLLQPEVGAVSHVKFFGSPAIVAELHTGGNAAIQATGTNGAQGISASSDSGDGVTGTSKSGHGVYGTSDTQVGVYGYSSPNWGVLGRSDTQVGVVGQSTSNWGVSGSSDTQVGVHGESTSHVGVYGISHSTGQAGVYGINDYDKIDGGAPGIWGESKIGNGVNGISHFITGAGIYGKNDAKGYAGLFDGKVQINGDAEINGTVTIASGSDLILADFSEEFDITITAEAEPGTVMVLNQQGALEPSRQAYDKKVAGVISGAGNFRPGLTLDRREPSEGRMPVALVGKVYCKVDAQYASIEVGDLLTTSPTPGYAMKADDPFKAFGAVIGKALRPLEAGQGMLPILIALQ